MFYISRIKLSFSSTFPGKITIFKAKLKIKHFLSTPLKFKHFLRSVTTLGLMSVKQAWGSGILYIGYTRHCPVQPTNFSFPAWRSISRRSGMSIRALDVLLFTSLLVFPYNPPTTPTNKEYIQLTRYMTIPTLCSSLIVAMSPPHVLKMLTARLRVRMLYVSAWRKIFSISGRITGATWGIWVSVTSRQNSAIKYEYGTTRLTLIIMA